MAMDGGHGDSHAGKSQALEELARHIYESSGKNTLVYIGDGGGETYNSHGLVDAGVIKLVDFSIRDYPLTVVKLITDFWVPKNIMDPGPVDPAAKLIAPSANLFDKFGLAIFEGGTVMGEYMMSDVPGGMSWHAGEETGFGGVKDEADELHTEDDKNAVSKVFEGDIHGANIQGTTAGKHNYIVQRKLLSAIRRTKKFPGLVWWTFHSTLAADKTEGATTKGIGGEIVGKAIIGPDAGGKALASTISKEFGNFLHFDKVTIKSQEKDETSKQQITTSEYEYRVYTKRHYDPNKTVQTEYLAGSRLSVDEYYASKEPGDSLLQFYQALADKREANRAKDSKPRA